MMYTSSVATVPTACGIETLLAFEIHRLVFLRVATVPTACGIETCNTCFYVFETHSCNSTYRLRY